MTATSVIRASDHAAWAACSTGPITASLKAALRYPATELRIVTQLIVTAALRQPRSSGATATGAPSNVTTSTVVTAASVDAFAAAVVIRFYRRLIPSQYAHRSGGPGSPAGASSGRAGRSPSSTLLSSVSSRRPSGVGGAATAVLHAQPVVSLGCLLMQMLWLWVSDRSAVWDPASLQRARRAVGPELASRLYRMEDHHASSPSAAVAATASSTSSSSGVGPSGVDGGAVLTPTAVRGHFLRSLEGALRQAGEPNILVTRAATTCLATVVDAMLSGLDMHHKGGGVGGGGGGLHHPSSAMSAATTSAATTGAFVL